MVLTNELSQKVIIAAFLVSFVLVIGSIYLHLQQKHHLGRLNIGDDRIQPTKGVVTLSRDDVLFVPPLVQRAQPSNAIEESRQIIENIEADYSASNSREDYIEAITYPNDDPSSITLTTTKSTESYVMDNDYNAPRFDYPSSESDDYNLNLGVTKNVLNDSCLRCLCKTLNECRPVTCSLYDPCGIYGISISYWMDGGQQLTMDNFNDFDEEDPEKIDYLRCANDDRCAADTVRGYIKRFQRDCNNDGVIDCTDHIALHILGPTGCLNKQLSFLHKLRMSSCIN
ncbi:uncharacterized protein LOC106091336 [Stomoxys calcitrans]|uniref:uncharacterized protein LOC106091336 n=1 Tax=Stomoxys calcitrans TaxID=35570 RepID=UPI0027E2B8BA|nr:uncharacterized protein LOC106091336 [Stomoxys calcitrans]